MPAACYDARPLAAAGARAVRRQRPAQRTAASSTLLTADYTFLNEHAGAALRHRHDVKGGQFRRVTLTRSEALRPAGQGRRADGHGLSRTARRRCCAARGSWSASWARRRARRRRMCGDLKDEAQAPSPPRCASGSRSHQPQPGLLRLPRRHGSAGLRARELRHRGQVPRASTRRRGEPIDTAGELPDGTKINGPDDLHQALAARPDQFVQTITEKLMTYALGRHVDYRDMPAVRAIVREAARDNYRFESHRRWAS